MSANIDSMMYVGETPWHGLGVKYDVAPTSSEEIIKGASLDWTVSSHQLSSDIDSVVPGVSAIYRDDNSSLLGLVNTSVPTLVQNSDTFIALEDMLGNELDVETAAALDSGTQVFGCFKIGNQYKVLDDDVESYLVVLNDHLKSDGRVTVINTPIRVVCQNTLSQAIGSALYKIRIPITDDRAINQNIIGNVFDTVNKSIKVLNSKAEEWSTTAIDRSKMDIVLDTLFPYPDTEDPYSERNMKMEMRRETFAECLKADDLANYRGSVYQVFNALIDYEDHYYAKADKAFDLKYRMSKIPGLRTETSMVQKFIKMQKKLFA
nr:MAG TPA: hypothetical protein [Caudoviricetes sp.]